MPAHTTPGWEKWKKMEPHRLARYIDPGVIAEVFAAAPGSTARLSQVGGATRFELAANVYAHLEGFGLRYDATPIDFTGHSTGEQRVRSAWEVHEDGGSCLDLSLVYAGLCERVGLRPLLVILRDHTLVAVALATGVEDARPRLGPVPGEETLLRQGLPADDHSMRAQLLARLSRETPQAGEYVMVECTGVSATQRLGGPTARLTFAEAVSAGYDQLAGGDLRHLVDPTYFHLQAGKGITPYAVRPPEVAKASVEAELGPIGAGRLTEMLELVGVTAPPRWNLAGLRRLAPLVAGLPTPQEPLVADAVRDLTEALVTNEFIAGWMPHVLTTKAMRQALRPPGAAPAATPAALHTLGDYLEHIALHHRDGPAGLRRWLASFVVNLAVDAGMDLDVEPVRRWANELNMLVDINDVARTVRAQRENARARLIVSLHAAVADDWPESLVGWWLLDGKPSEPKKEDCEPSQRGLEAAVRRLLEWADDEIQDHEPGLELEQVDIAIPTGLLLRWQPEEAEIGGRLVQHHQVVTRWGDRLWRDTRHVRKRFKAILQAASDKPVLWLDSTVAADLDGVAATLRNGLPDQAIGLRFHPEGQETLLDTVLEQSPILVWPERGLEADGAAVAELHGCWPDVPRSLTDAYRTRREPLLARPLAGLRAVWDDEEWLRFCRSFAGPRAS
ncbi:hypothetical protein AB0H83_29155 [Dactylosporangium sp. NPDC050688]|uniref:vWA-MoxR associated conflict system protein n=1 Tax=Dactylosporangium sp. NPDC050688 TaxID=3157217 RepID=UPI0033ED6936